MPEEGRLLPGSIIKCDSIPLLGKKDSHYNYYYTAKKSSWGNERIRARRSKDQIILEILRICANGENVTKIVYQTNTNFTTIKGYLHLLTKNDLIESPGASPRLFKTTPKGIDMMNRLKTLQKEMEELVV